jgi:ABC-type lipoprotein export system ATPase subunit
MKKLTINFENCYGIKKLEYSFDFSKRNTYSIYAPNGFMKTSFSKTFLDLSEKRDSVDLIFPDRISIRNIKDDASVDINAENIFVIQPYNESFQSEQASLLLVNEKLKKQYDDALRKIDERKQGLLKSLKEISGLTSKASPPETEMLQCFGENSFFSLIEKLEDTIKTELPNELGKLSYIEIFNEKTLPLLKSGKISSELSNYIEKYNQLVENSSILKRTFNHYHAKTITKSLLDNGFFSASHSVNIFNGQGKDEITTAKALDEKIEGERRKILSDKDLEKKFDEIDKKLSNVELRKFREYLFDHKEVVVALADYKKLQKDIWIAYLIAHQAEFLALVAEYKTGKAVIEAATIAAKDEKTEWEKVVKIFNSRFAVPFRLSIENQEDVILKGKVPKIVFNFDDTENALSVDREKLLQVLSQGEKRALYLLNIIFELNVRRQQHKKCIVVIDDIADSFDYKNKYAIVEYLFDTSLQADFYLIFLTHNFDFHRTISSRLHIGRNQRLTATKTGRVVNLTQEKYQKNPFDVWKGDLNIAENLIACIPFVRNLAEYCGCQNEYLKLTSLLHIKPDTATFTIGDLQPIFISILRDKQDLVLDNASKLLIDHIKETADHIHDNAVQSVELESKIVLAIAIRLCAETYMIAKINDSIAVAAIGSNQTKELISMFKIKLSSEIQAIEILEKVNLMTPENIHLNSFMYEPLLDMAPDNLKQLYFNIKQLA